MIRPARWAAAERRVLLVACLAQFMVVLDVSVVNVALPEVRAGLGSGLGELQWVANAYTLAFAGLLLLGGRAADLFGRRRTLLAGLTVFAVAGLLGGFAPDSGVLIAARAAQGCAAAVVGPASLTILSTAFPEGPARVRAVGVWSVVAAAGSATGSLAGGLLTASLGWRSTLLVNVPLAVAALVLATGAVRDDGTRRRRRLDLTGALLVTAGLVLGVLTLVTAGGTPWAGAGYAGAALLLGGFVLWEARWAAEPLVPLGVFRSRAVTGANLVMALYSAGTTAMWFLMTFFLQNVQGRGPLQTGLVFLPQSLAIMAGARLTPVVAPRAGPRSLVVLGALLSAAGFAWLSRVGPASAYLTGVAGPGVLVTLGVGIATAPLVSTGTGGVPASRAGLVSGLLTTSRQMGGALGLAGLTAVAAGGTSSAALTRAAARGEGYGHAFAAAALLLLLAAACALILPAGPAAERRPAGALPAERARSSAP